MTQAFSQLIELIKNLDHSPSHQLDHLQRVATFGRLLAERHGGDPEIVAAAALVHDLGRNDVTLSGKASAVEGAHRAEPILKEAGYSPDQIAKITQAVAEHDQPAFHSELLESRMLKDADFLDGFGARGIYRAMMYSGETGGGLPAALKRLTAKTNARIAGLEFPESRRLAWKLTRLTEYFADMLSAEPSLENETYSGKFIVFEGISGSGKDTQLAEAANYLASKSIPHLTLNHPTSFFKEKVWHNWRAEVEHPVSEFLMMAADRVRMVQEVIMPALKEGKVVLSARSGISSQAYQQNDTFPASFHRLVFQFEPMPDLVLFLKLSPAAALKRVDDRVEAGQEASRGFFGANQAEIQERYQAVLAAYPNVQEVSADGSIDQVQAQVVACLQKNLSV